MSDQDRTRRTSNIVKRVDDLEDALQEVNAPVTSVNTKTGDVVLTAQDVGALPDDTVIPPDYGPPPTLPEKIVNTVNGEDGDIVITPESIGALPDDAVIPEPNYPVTSVNSKTGDVVLTAQDVGALPEDTQIPVLPQFIVNTVNSKSGNVVLTAQDVGALPDDTTIPPDYGPPPVTSVNGQTGKVVLVIPPPAPVDSVNGKIGVVVLTAADVGAMPGDTEIPQPIDPPVKSVNGKTGDVELSVEDLKDVVLTTETAGEVLRFDGTNWVNSEEAVQELHSSDGSVSVTNEGNGKWDLIVLSSGGDGPGTDKTYALSGQDGVTVELDPASNETLTKWIAKADGAWFDARYAPENIFVPTKTSQLENDGNGEGSPFATQEEVAAGIGSLNMNLPISSEDTTVTIDGENNKASVYGNSGLPDITPIVLEIKTTTNGSGWSTEDAWGKLSFWNDDLSSGGAKQHAFIECSAWTSSGGQSKMSFGTSDNTWMTVKPTGSINFTPLDGTNETEDSVQLGDTYFDSRYNYFRYWNGTEWRDLSGDSSANGYFWQSRGEAVCIGAGITESSPVIPVNIGTKFTSNNYMLADGGIYYITLGTKSTGSVSCAKYVVRKINSVFTAEIMSSNNQVSNTPIISVRPTTQIDPGTGLPYANRQEVVLWDNHAGGYTHTWNIEGMLTGSVQQQFSINNPWYTVGTSIYQSDNSTYVCLDNINSKDQAIQDVAWNYSSGSFYGKWGDPSDTGVKSRVQFNAYDAIATIAQAPNPSNNDTYGRWYERPRRNLKLYSGNCDSVFEVSTNTFDGNYYCYNGDPAEAFAEGLFKAVEYDGEGINAENVTKIRISARDKNSKDMNHTRTYVSPEYLEDSNNINGTDWMQLQIVQDDGSRLSAAYMITSGGYTSTGSDAPAGSQPYYEYGVKWYGSGTAGGTDLNGGQEGAAHFVQYFRNNTGMLISENGSTQLARLSVDFNHADGGFYTAATARIAAERQGSSGGIQMCGYTQVNATIGLVKNFQADYYTFDIYARQEKVGSFSNTGLEVDGGLSGTLLSVTTDSSTCAVFTSSSQSSQVKCVSESGTTWHGINSGKWAVDYYPTGSTTYTEGLRLDLDDGRVTSKGGIGTDIITTKDAAAGDASIELGANAKITAGVAYYQILNNGYHIFQSDGSQSRFTNDGDFLIGTSTPFAGSEAIDATKNVVLATGKKGIARWSAHETSNSQTTDLYLSCDYDTSEVVFNSNSQVVLNKNDGSGYTPTKPSSIATKAYVDANAGGGGIPIYAPDGKAVFNADDFQNQADWISKAGDTITPSANDVFYITANAASTETATVALFNGQASKPKRGLHILNRVGDTNRTNGQTILEQRSADSAGQVGTNPASALGVLSMNVDGWQHLRMSKGNVAIGETTTSYSTVKLNVSGGLISSSSFGVYLETTVIGADATEEAPRSFFGFTSTPQLEADLSYLYHFRPYYSSSPTPTKTVLVEENGFLVDHKITQSCPKRIAFKSAMKPINDADRSIFVTTGSAPSEFGSEIRCNTFTSQAAAVGDAKITISSGTVKISNTDYTGLIIENESTGSVMGFRSADDSTYYVGMSAVLGFQVIDTDGQSPLITHSAGNHCFYKANSTAKMLQIKDDRIRAASDYEPDGDYDLATKKYVDANTGSGTGSETLEGLTDTDINSPVPDQFLVFRGGKWTNVSSTSSVPIIPPGENAGVEWDAFQWPTIAARNMFKVGLDGIFTDGMYHSTNGILWQQATSTVNGLLQSDSSQIHKSTSQSNWYINDAGTAYSNDMRNWFSIESLGSTTSNGGPYGNVFCFNGEFYLIARERVTNNQGVPLTWKFLQYNRFYNQWLDPEDSTISGNIYAWLATQDEQASVGYAPWWTDSQGVSGNYVLGRMSDGTVISLDPVTAEVSTVANLTGVRSIRYGGEKFVAQFDTGTKSIATSENPITSDWGNLAMYPKAGPYEVPEYDGIGRWHIMPSEQNRLLYLYADDRENMVWIQNTNIGPKATDGNNYLTAANGRVILGSVFDGDLTSPDYTISQTYYLSGIGISAGNYEADSKVMSLEKRILKLEALIKEKCS